MSINKINNGVEIAIALVITLWAFSLVAVRAYTKHGADRWYAAHPVTILEYTLNSLSGDHAIVWINTHEETELDPITRKEIDFTFHNSIYAYCPSSGYTNLGTSIYPFDPANKEVKDSIMRAEQTICQNGKHTDTIIDPVVTPTSAIVTVCGKRCEP